MIQSPKISAAYAKKYAGKPAIFLGKKIVHVGEISTKKQYQKVMENLLKKHPRAQEEDFGFTFILGSKSYAL